VEYRPIKEPDSEIDYIIRYYPGPGARESNARIQTFIRDRRNRGNLRSMPADVKQASAAEVASPPSAALSVITVDHHELIIRLIVSFHINPLKACHLVLTRKEAVSIQLEAWPFRQATPRNLAGWMIQAIENNYDLPPSYLDHKNKQRDRQTRQLALDKIRLCALRREGFSVCQQ
jgi:hypothetical protein